MERDEMIVTADSAEDMLRGKWKTMAGLVRCRDYEFYDASEKWCRRLGLCGVFDLNDYCSHGELREDAEKTD